MKKEFSTALVAIGLSAAVLLTGCSGKESTQTAVKGAITGYLVENADKYVKLGDYKKLPVDEAEYPVTDDDVLMEIDALLQQNAVYDEVDRPAEYGDTLSIDFTATPDGGPSLSQDDYSIEIGMADFGTDFDDRLVGLKAGDTFKTTVAFDDAVMVEDWVDANVTFDVTVNSVATLNIPELTDDYVKENSEYSTVDEYKEGLRASLETTYASDSRATAIQTLMSDAIANSTFSGYPDALYDELADMAHTGYEQFAESMNLTVDELYEYYEMTAEDVENEILNTVNQRLFISELCRAENLALTEETYKEYLTQQATANGYDDVDAFESDYGKESVIWSAYENLAGEFLYKNAVVTKTVYDYDAFDLGTSFEEDFEYSSEGETALEIDGLAE